MWRNDKTELYGTEREKTQMEMTERIIRRIDNDIIRSSDAFRNLNSWLMQLIYLCCCK